MTLHHLKVFVMVCQEKTMHAAAEKLNISQPAISKIIADLEKHYNIKLFERINHRLYLTAIGETVRDHALNILAMFQDMEDQINIQGQQNHIRIGASVSVGTCLLPPLIQSLKKRLDSISYEVTINNTSKIEGMVNDYLLDLALVEGYVDNPNLVVQNVIEDELVFAVRADHPLLQKTNIAYHDLEQYSFITREDGSSKRNQLELHLQEMGIQLKINYSCSTVEAIKQALLYTDGIASLSKMMVEEELKTGVLKTLPFHDMKFERSVRLIYHKNKYISPTMKVFIEVLNSQIKERSNKSAT